MELETLYKANKLNNKIKELELLIERATDGIKISVDDSILKVAGVPLWSSQHSLGKENIKEIIKMAQTMIILKATSKMKEAEEEFKNLRT